MPTAVNHLRQTLRHVRNRIQPGAAIVLYHRVADLKSDPQMLAVSTERFEEHISILRNRYNVITLNELHEAIAQQKIDRNTVVITFDDGYYDNYKYALPILESHQVPATFFIATANLGTNNEFWWDELERIILTTAHLPNSLDIVIEGMDYHWETGQFAHLESFNVLDDGPRHPRHEMYTDLCQLVRPLSVEKQRDILDRLARWANVDTAGRASHRTMTHSELREFNKSEYVSIGGHTHNHCELSALTAAQQRFEIETNRQQLELILGQQVDTFSYPFGSRSAYNGDSVMAAQNAGYHTACSNFPGIVRKDANLYELPRLLVRNWSGKHFAGQLRRWFGE